MREVFPTTKRERVQGMPFSIDSWSLSLLSLLLGFIHLCALHSMSRFPSKKTKKKKRSEGIETLDIWPDCSPRKTSLNFRKGWWRSVWLISKFQMEWVEDSKERKKERKRAAKKKKKRTGWRVKRECNECWCGWDDDSLIANGPLSDHTTLFIIFLGCVTRSLSYFSFHQFTRSTRWRKGICDYI